ncbi:MAG: hypothetical protein J1E06_02735 [Acutalibacter sp.]|nr:hypothetical protein [Acutalibacter sp.]
MGEPERAKRFFCRLFRRAGKVALETSTGESFSGRGVITALKNSDNEWGGLRHGLGVLDRPLYRFLGTLPMESCGQKGVLTQSGHSYQVLRLSPVRLGEYEICMSGLLERREQDEEP